jgi:acetyl esterase/lipase
MNVTTSRIVCALAFAALICAAPVAARPVTVAYGTAGDAQTLDIYRTNAPAPARLVVFVHGGGWTKGDKAGGWKIARVLTAQGYVVASINYRLLDPAAPNQAALADAATDVAAATAFLLRHAADYGIDPSRYALMGHSAGGHLVALVGTDPFYARAAGLDLDRLAAVVALDGVFDIRPFHSPNPVLPTDPDYRWKMSPSAHTSQVTARPLFCVVHEDMNRRFGPDADAFVAALQSHGVRTAETIAPGLTHGQLVGEFDNPATPTASQVETCLDAAFLK